MSLFTKLVPPRVGLLPLALLLSLSFSCTGGDGDGSEQTSKSSGAAAVSPDPGEPAKKKTAAPPKALAFLKDAMTRAKDENKIVMVELYDITCNYCEDMEVTIEDESVQEALKNFVHVQITPEKTGVIRMFRLHMSPAFLFFKPGKGKVGPAIHGFRSPDVFVAELENVKLRSEGKDEKPVPEDIDPKFGLG